MSSPSPDVPHQEYDVIVVGAGVLGSALAASLGRSRPGCRILILERDWSEPDRIVGELLQPGGVNALTKLGLADCLEDIDSIPCFGYCVFYPPEEVIMSYPQNIKPNVGRSFHHGRFVMNLRKAAKQAPNVTGIEGTATELLTCPISDRIVGVAYSEKNADGKTESRQAYAPLTVVADGCFSKFRKQIVSKEVSVKSNFVGMVLTDCELPYQNRGHVVLGKPSPILLYQIGTHDTRILVDIPGKLPSIGNGDLQRYMQDHIGPQLPKSVQPSFYASLKTSRLRSMPNSWLPPSTNTREGLILIGDAMNMRHPLTGGGMTVAFWDVVHICDLLSKKEIRDLADSNAVLRQMKVLHWRRKPLSSVINILAQALYDLFSAGDDVNMRNLQMACFGYFKLGGKCVTTPMGLIAGMIPEPMTLTGHFFAVAFYGCWLIIKSQPLWMLPQTLFRSFMAIYTAAVVIFPVIASEIKK